jgi:hypothetical protein
MSDMFNQQDDEIVAKQLWESMQNVLDSDAFFGLLIYSDDDKWRVDRFLLAVVVLRRLRVDYPESKLVGLTPQSQIIVACEIMFDPERAFIAELDKHGIVDTTGRLDEVMAQWATRKTPRED